MLSKISLAINAILLVLVINLYMSKDDTNNEVQEEVTTEVDSSKPIRLAYLNTDSLDANYLYAIEIVETLQDEMNKKQRRLERKATKLQQEFNQLQQAARSMTPTQMQAAQQRAVQMEQEIQIMQQEYAAEFAEQERKLQIDLTEDLDGFLEDYNKDANYDFIIKKHNGSDIILAGENFDITSEVLKKLNDRYLSKDSIQ